MNSRLSRSAAALLLASAWLVPPAPFNPPPVRAQVHEDVAAERAFDQWRIEATQTYRGVTDNYWSHEEIDWVYDPLALGGLSWSVAHYENHWTPTIPCGAGYDSTGFGSGSDPGRTGVYGTSWGADTWGLSDDEDWTVFEFYSAVTFTIETTHWGCDSTHVTTAQQAPYYIPIWLPGTPEELNALPIGTIIEFSYSCGPGVCQDDTANISREISYTATKQLPPPNCEGYQHEVNAVGGSAGSSLFNFDSIVTFRACEPADGGLSFIDEITAVNSYASLDAGVMAGTLSALGFDIRLRVDSGEPIPEPIRYQYAPNAFEVTTYNGFDICFDFMTLLDKVGMRQKLGKVLTDVLLRKAERLMRSPVGDLVKVADEWFATRAALESQFAGYADKLLGRIPLAGQLGLSQFAVNAFGDLLIKVDNVVNTAVGYGGSSAGAHHLAVQIGAFVNDFAANATTACFEVWEPAVTHHVSVAMGNEAYAYPTLDGFKNPFVWARVEDELR